jgi:transcriptional regulator with XRE-family HTH domain
MDNVAAALKATNYSALARQTNTTPGFVSLLFRGLRGARMATIQRLAKELAVTTDDLCRHLSRVQEKRRRSAQSDVAA